MSIRTAIPNRFAGKPALVTGGTAGIGHAIATELMREGCKVAVSTSPVDAGAGREAFSALGFAPLILEGDMANEAFCRHLVGETAKQFGPVHFLVNNAFSFVAAYQGSVLPYCHLHSPDEVLDVWTPGGFPAIPADSCVRGVYDRSDPVISHWQTGIGCAKFPGVSPRRLDSASMALRL